MSTFTGTRHHTSSSDILYFTEYGAGSPLLLVHGVMITGEMSFAVNESVVRADFVVVIGDLEFESTLETGLCH